MGINSIDFEELELLFSQFPGRYTIYNTDYPKFTIFKISDDLLADLNGKREDYDGRSVFEAFPINPNDPEAEEDKNTYLELFEKEISEKKEVKVPVKKYDVKNPETGTFEETYWSNIFKPIVDKKGEVKFLINFSRDITETIKLQERERKAQERYKRQQKVMHDFFQQAPVAIAIYTGPEFIVEMANPVFGQVIGRDVETILNRPIFDSIPELEKDYREMHERVLYKGERVVGRENLAQLIRNGKKEDAYFDFVYEPMKEEDGSIVGVFTIAIEVTKQVLLRKKIEANELRLKFSIQAAKMGTWEIDVEKETTIRDARHDEIFGYEKPPKDWDFGVFLSHIHPEDREHALEGISAAKSLKPFSFETRIVTSDGKIKWIELFGVPDAGGEKRMFGVIADITERKTLEVQKEDYLVLLKDYNKELEELTQAKGQFISVISNDLRNPLTVITSSSDIILQNIETIDRGDAENLVRVIHNSSIKVIAKLSELVEMSKSKKRIQLSTRWIKT
ncbi:MAG: PAS domain-containing protein [Bacteroidetes bacterium]|nr:PAS domain-containing protein [Bacteroidota bacterium]